ncbi:MAG TPA: glycosyltransferase [Pseudolysinimonas sp.]
MPDRPSTARPRILCISLAPFRNDARVLRQVGVLREFGDVTTVGFGPAPDGVADHIEVPVGLKTLPQTVGGVIGLALRRWKQSELAAPAVRYAYEALKDREFDLVVANEARVLGLGHTLAKGAPVWGDMHEWSPGERTHILSWRLLVGPFMTYLCAKYLPISAAVTAVSDSVAKLYDEHFGIRTHVMRNTGPYRDLKIQPVADDRIRLVHSGVAVHGRKIELMIDVMKQLDERYTLEMWLMAGQDGGAYLKVLKARAGGDPRIIFHDPVAPTSLPDVINNGDIGVFWLPPTHTNARYTLPNKFFDFVQARLAIAVGPTIEMALLTRKYHLGVVSDGFEIDDLVRSIRELDVEAIRAAKKASDAAARELSFDTDANVARGFLRAALAR